MATVAVDYMKNSGAKGSIYLRFTHKMIRRRVALDIQIPAKDWNARKQEVRRSNPRFLQHNKTIGAAKATANDVLSAYERNEIAFTADDLKTAFEERFLGRAPAKSGPSTTFSEYAREQVRLFEANGKISSANNHTTSLNKLEDFHQRRTSSEFVQFADLTPAYLEDFRIFLRGKPYENGPSTIHKNLRCIRRIVNDAIRAGHMHDYPFKHFKMGVEKRQKDHVYLTRGELDNIKDLDLKTGSGRWHVRNGFLFSVFQQGIRIADLLQLKWSSVIESNGQFRVSYRMRKNNKVRSNKLVPPARAILDLYENTGPNRYVFPFLENFRPDELGDREYFDLLKRRTAYINKELRKIAKQAGVEKRVSSHVARHTFANLALDYGWTLFELNQALDHSSLEVTQKYIRELRDEELDEKHEAMWEWSQ